MIINGYMVLNNNMMDENNDIHYEIGKSYEHDKGFQIFEFHRSLNHIAESDAIISKSIIVEVSVDDKELMGSNGCFKSNNIIILREVTVCEILNGLQARLRSIRYDMLSISGLVNKNII